VWGKGRSGRPGAVDNLSAGPQPVDKTGDSRGSPPWIAGHGTAVPAEAGVIPRRRHQAAPGLMQRRLREPRSYDGDDLWDASDHMSDHMAVPSGNAGMVRRWLRESRHPTETPRTPVIVWRCHPERPGMVGRCLRGAA
jgi:hypothetical protein